MPDFPPLLELARLDEAGTIASSNGVLITKPGVANTKGAWIQLIAATPAPAGELWLSFNLASTTGGADLLFDIGIGPAGQEQVLVPNLMVSQGSLTLGVLIRLPAEIPPGTRIAARVQSSNSINSCNLAAYLGVPAWGFPPGSQAFDDLGTSLGNSRGTNIDCGAVANTKSAYVQLAAATPRAYRGLLVLIGNGGRVAPAAASFTVDIARGPAGQEQIILPDLLVRGNASFYFTNNNFGPVHLHIPAGERLAARAQSSTAVATDRLVDVQLIGVT